MVERRSDFDVEGDRRHQSIDATLIHGLRHTTTTTTSHNYIHQTYKYISIIEFQLTLIGGHDALVGRRQFAGPAVRVTLLLQLCEKLDRIVDDVARLLQQIRYGELEQNVA